MAQAADELLDKKKPAGTEDVPMDSAASSEILKKINSTYTPSGKKPKPVPAREGVRG